MTREEMCVRFCEGLPDGSILSAITAGAGAKMIWNQRDIALMILAQHEVILFDQPAWADYVAGTTH